MQSRKCWTKFRFINTLSSEKEVKIIMNLLKTSCVRTFVDVAVAFQELDWIACMQIQTWINDFPCLPIRFTSSN